MTIHCLLCLGHLLYRLIDLIVEWATKVSLRLVEKLTSVSWLLVDYQLIIYGAGKYPI